MNWQTDAQPSPALLVLPAGAASLDEADAAIELFEHYTRKTLDPTQRLAVQVMMAKSADGGWAAATTGREMPRQNGKGDELEVVELWGLVQRSEAILHTIHDAVLLASQTQERMLGILEGHADLRRRVKRKWTGTGQQMIEMRNGGVIWYRTRTKGGGRGVDDIDRLVIDEAQHATEDQLAAVTPTLLANPDPQMNAVGTAGLVGESAWWWHIRKRALSPDPGAFGYVGHTGERLRLVDGRVISERPDVEDRDVWKACNPALHAGRGRGMDFFDEQFRNLGPDKFAQEHLCVWAPEPYTSREAPIDPDLWESLAELSAIDSHHAWSLAVSPDRRWTAIAKAGRRTDGLLHVEVVEHRPTGPWIIERCFEMWSARRIPVRVHKDGAESSYIGELRDAGIEVTEVTASDYAKATGSLLDAANGRRLRHHGQRVLDRALLDRAELRTSTSGASTWQPREQSDDITTVKAVTVAVGGVLEVTEPDAVPLGAWR